MSTANKLWGDHKVTLSPFSFQSLKLKWCLDGLGKVSGKILDVGCGAGGLTKAIKEKRADLEVYGIDNNQQAIKMAKVKAQKVNFKLSDAHKIDYGNYYFDALVMFDVLEHLKNPELVLKEIRRVLKPNGVFHFFIPIEKQPFTLYWVFLYKLNWQAKKRQSGHLVHYSCKDLEFLLRANKFKIVETRFSNHLFFQIMDLTYYAFWEVLGNAPKVSIETYLENSQSKFKKITIGMVKNFFILLFWIESYIFQKVPSGGVNITAVKIK